MICVRDVRKSFDGTVALDGFGMTVKGGSVYGLVGTNGAGKTTILRMLAGVLKPDAGDITIAEMPVFENEAVKERLTFIPDDLSFINKYTPKDLARLYASLYDRWDGALMNRIMWEFGLDMKVPLSRFSKGMQKQAVFALALATTPEYLLLDEPIDGLDPFAKRMVWYYITEASKIRGMTTLVSSHNLREMEGVCESVGIIDHGHMVLEKELDELRGDIHKVQISFGRGEGGSASATPEGAYAGLNVVHIEQRGAVDIIIARESREALEGWNAEFSPLLFDPIPLTLEEVFIYELGDANHANSSIFE